MSYSKQQTIVHHNEGAGSTRRENRGRAEQRKYNKVSKKEISARELKQINRMMQSRIQVLIEEIAATASTAAPEAYRPSKEEQRNMAKYKRNRQDHKYENTISVFVNDEDASDTVLMKQPKLDDNEDDHWPDCWNWTHSYEEDDEYGLVPMQM